MGSAILIWRRHQRHRPDVARQEPAEKSRYYVPLLYPNCTETKVTQKGNGRSPTPDAFIWL